MYIIYRRATLLTHSVPYFTALAESSHSLSTLTRFPTQQIYPSAPCEVRTGDRAQAPGKSPADPTKRREVKTMWEAIAAMTLLCVLVLVAYQVIEKFRERKA
jgi:hypothetical protein